VVIDDVTLCDGKCEEEGMMCEQTCHVLACAWCFIA